jgi:hypothetical protein
MSGRLRAIPSGPTSEIPPDYDGPTYPLHPDGVWRDHPYMPWHDTTTGRLICTRCPTAGVN